jgi:hypothetical protein
MLVGLTKTVIGRGLIILLFFCERDVADEFEGPTMVEPVNTFKSRIR